MRAHWELVVAASIALVAGCGGSPSQSGPDSGGGVDLATAMDLAGDDFAGVDFSSVDLASATDGPRASTDLATQSTGGNCPNLVGSYSITETGAGCGNLNVNAPECIGNVVSSCVAQFSSTMGAQLGAIVGSANLLADGSFSGAALQLGTNNRTGCTGTWDAGTGTLIVDCGGMGTSQSCVVTLTRKSTSCP